METSVQIKRDAEHVFPKGVAGICKKSVTDVSFLAVE